MMTDRTLLIQRYNPEIREFEVTEHAVTTERDEQGILFVYADGVRFGMAYLTSKGEESFSCLGHYSGFAGRAGEIARQSWVSGTGLGAPHTRGSFLKAVAS